VAEHRIRRCFQFGILDLVLMMTIAAVAVVLWRAPRTETYYEPLAEGMMPGQHWAGNGLRMKFRWCPAGEFKMGTLNRIGVTLTHGFWLAECEVTQGEYRQVVDDNPSFFPEKGRDAGLAAGVDVDRLPVENVSWDDAVEFSRRFTQQEQKVGRLPPGWEYRLPTEAQSEYACRAGTQTRYSFGDDESRLADFAWHQGNSDKRTREVGQKLPNAWGLRDMHGNVWEWCRDAYQLNRVGGTDPEVVASNRVPRVPRGGGWRNTGGDCRSAIRRRSTLDGRYDDVGFRVALVQAR
jgi:formylglycine-generating enzyme required for sulfatase activity